LRTRCGCGDKHSFGPQRPPVTRLNEPTAEEPQAAAAWAFAVGLGILTLRVWPKILIRLQSEPEATAKTLLERLDQKFRSQFPEGRLRTLQRRVREWRRVTAREVVFGSQDAKNR
jgi:hypothetical protein